MAQAIVTGGAVRLGRAISLALAEAGYDIILIFNNSFDASRKTAEDIRERGRECHMHKCDLRNKESIDSLYAQLSQKHDDIRLLVNNASIFERGSFLETSEQMFDSHMTVNFKAQFFMTQNFARYVLKREYIDSAHIVNMLDKNVVSDSSAHFAYLLSKKIFRDFTKMAANELAPKIRVNSISLGRILPPKSTDDIKLNFNEFPRVKEITDNIIQLDKSADFTGRNITIESDIKLI